MGDDKFTSYDRAVDKYTLNPAPAYNFALQVEGFFFVPLKSVRVFNREHEFDYYQEGGLNDYVHMLRKPISKPFTFQVEKYVGVSTSSTANFGPIDCLALGTDLILPVILYVSRYPSYHFWENMNPETAARVYIFTGCTVTAKEFGELNAERSALATETTTIAYRELIVINNFSNSFDKDAWKSEATAETGTSADEAIWFKDASNTKYANKAKDKYTRQDGLDHAKSDMWVIDSSDYKGKGKRHVQTDKGDSKNPTKSDQQTKGGQDAWNIDQYDYKGKGKRHVQTDKKDMKDPTKKDQESKAEKDMWIMGGDDYKGNNRRHVQTDKGDKLNPTKKAQQDAGKAGSWAIDASDYKGGGQRHVATDKGDKDNPTKSAQTEKGTGNTWVYDGTLDGGGNSHTENRNNKNNPSKSDQAEKGAENTWVYDGTLDGGGKSHPENRNTNQKATPVTWPPTRRALMADALSKK